jgi:hypothetical protein
MNKYLRRLLLALKAVAQLPPRESYWYARYTLGRWTGFYKAASPVRVPSPGAPAPNWAAAARTRELFPLPPADGLAALIGADGLIALRSEADEIVDGKVRLFGGLAVDLRLAPPGPLKHWTAYQKGTFEGEDIKFTWEPARFGWAFTLGRAYLLLNDERYPDAFWRYAEAFLNANPPNAGPNWASAQEAALRLIAFTFALQVFRASIHSTPERRSRLAVAISDHAARIQLTLSYARAQNNNHLLSETAGLYTAGRLLAWHPQAKTWRELGWKWFTRGILRQFSPEGAYSQHSVNYTRLALHLALWMNRLGPEPPAYVGSAPPPKEMEALKNRAGMEGPFYPDAVRRRLESAVRWLLEMADPLSGRLPNLGPNDGALLLPLAGTDFGDYRPLLQAAGLAFLTAPIYEPGPWDEPAAWLGLLPSVDSDPSRRRWTPLVGLRRSETGGQPAEPELPAALVSLPPREPAQTPHVLRTPGGDTWAYLRVARFSGRPGHADQLHLDLWRNGENIAIDPGTYLYNASAPWDNPLMAADVHNTVTIDGREPMTRAGRFLLLDWAQAKLVERVRGEDGGWERVIAEHNGYSPQGVTHRRSVTAFASGVWWVEDSLLPLEPNSPEARISHLATLHWLLPDWPWEPDTRMLDGAFSLRIRSPQGVIRLKVQAGAPSQPAPANGSAEITRPIRSAPIQLRVCRAGALVYGTGAVQPRWGWYSPTYGVKLPALSLRFDLRGPLPLSLISEWDLSTADI